MRKTMVRDTLLTAAGLTFAAALTAAPAAAEPSRAGGVSLVETGSVVLVQGQRPGGQRGGFRGMMVQRGGPTLLMRPDVQQELKITEAQQGQLREAIGFGFGGRQGGRPPGNPGARPPGNPGDRAARAAETDKKLREVLNETQYTRYHELSLQYEGPPALVRPEVAEKIGLSADQRTQIQSLMEASGERQRGLFPGAGGGQRPDPQALQQLRARMEQSRTQLANEIVGTLTPEQKARWQSLQGQAFTFQQIPFGGREGGRPLRNPRRNAPANDSDSL